MKVHELRDSRYLTKDDVDPPVNVMIKAVAKENVAMEGEEPREKYVMFFHGNPKGIVLNMTNGMLLEEITGSDNSDDWIGRKIQLYNDPTIMFGGKRVGGIRIRAIGRNPKGNHFAKELVENYTEPSVDQVNADLQEAAELNRRKHQPQAQPVEDDDENLPF
jgi:hypothetical protein